MFVAAFYNSQFLNHLMGDYAAVIFYLKYGSNT